MTTSTSILGQAVQQAWRQGARSRPERHRRSDRRVPLRQAPPASASTAPGPVSSGSWTSATARPRAIPCAKTCASTWANAICPECNGARLRPEAARFGSSVAHPRARPILSIGSALEFFENVELSKTELEEIAGTHSPRDPRAPRRSCATSDSNYLSLTRTAGTLSGGESQRIRLATQVGSALVGVLYILDEPSIGLHARDNRRLLETLFSLRDMGNTRARGRARRGNDSRSRLRARPRPGRRPPRRHSSWPRARRKQIERNPKSITGQFLSGKRASPSRPNAGLDRTSS